MKRFNRIAAHCMIGMCVAAFGGFENVMHAYEVALQEGYRFGPYGDAMLII